MIHSKGKIQYGTTTIPYHIIKSKRIKTSEIIVDSDEVTIRTPLNKSPSDIKRIVSGKASWILKKQNEYKELTPQIINPHIKKVQHCDSYIILCGIYLFNFIECLTIWTLKYCI